MASLPASHNYRPHSTLSNVEDDEFEQKEDVATGIADTLERYTVESTFKEYLANADDCEAATQVNWLLDERHHPKQHLLSGELQAYQGPALLVHNDGIFLDKDYEGFKRVGRGSKRNDSTKIGKFGRGSQTMYHWTDVPMLLSGKYLLILDPLRQVLEVNPRTGLRKPGVRIELSKLSGAYDDQLAPFEDMWGFSKGQDFYNGTIFRFALRPRTAHSRLRESTTSLDCAAARSYLHRFFEEDGRIALLFLRRIRYMDFTIHGESKARWSVKSSGMDGNFSGWTDCTLTKSLGQDLECTSRNRWWVAIQNLAELPTDLQPPRLKRIMKDVECGIAALIPDENSEPTPMSSNPIVPKFFSTLPLPFASNLPVHIHATFQITGDRQSIPIEEPMRDAGADWNRWLLSSAIPRLFLAFLEDLGRRIEKSTYFTFWPQIVPPKGSLAELVFLSFWRMLPESSCRLFPLVSLVGTNSKARHPPTLLETSEATFDLLPSDVSLVLKTILEHLIPTIVKASTGVTEQILAQKVPVKAVTPTMLREIFRGTNASNILQEAASANPQVLEKLLEIIQPSGDKDFEELDGCRCLPLADDSLGTIKLIDSSESADYYLASEDEVKLFNFASAILISQEPSKEFKQALVKSRKFNIAPLTISSIGYILKKRVLKGNVTEEMDKWMVNFWTYWKRIEGSDSIAVKTLMSTSDIRNHRIFEATGNGIRGYMRPSSLDSLAAVIDPSDKKHQALCGKFPGILRVNQSFLPQYLKITEATFDKRQSFRRFIKAVVAVAGKEGSIVECYIRDRLAPADIETLQKLVLNFVSKIESNQDAECKPLLRCFPVWPSMESPNYIPAANALATINSRLLVPWTRNFGRFIDPNFWEANQAVLKALGIEDSHDHDLLTLRILPTLPDQLSTPEEKSRYGLFIRAISQMINTESIHNDLCRSKLAPDRAGILRPAKELFDHNSSIFTSAFRTTAEEDSKFILGEFEIYSDFWLKIGLLEGRPEILRERYIHCLQALRKRLENCKDISNDTQLRLDSDVVLRPITAENAYCGFSANTWARIATEAIFPAQPFLSSQPSYRQETMALIVTAVPLLSLSEVFSYQHIPVCWSQISFAMFEPTVRSFDSLPSQGKPPAAMAWRHLEHLANLVTKLDEAQFGDFLSDLYSTYQYLQDNIHESSVSFTIGTKKVWLNIDICDSNAVLKTDLLSNWYSIDHLVLSSACDIGNIMSVREGLMPYEKLLKALGCEPIVYPIVPAADESTMESVSSAMQRMKCEGKLLDVTLVAEGKPIRAHKLILAATSSYFAAQFNGSWCNNEAITLEDIAHPTLEIMVDFAYADAEKFDWTSMRCHRGDSDDTVADKLDVFLDLLTGADRFGMPALMKQVENNIVEDGRIFIRPDNVKDVLARASEGHARRVERLCAEFYERNKSKVDKVYEAGVRDGMVIV